MHVSMSVLGCVQMYEGACRCMSVFPGHYPGNFQGVFQVILVNVVNIVVMGFFSFIVAFSSIKGKGYNGFLCLIEINCFCSCKAN